MSFVTYSCIQAIKDVKSKLFRPEYSQFSHTKPVRCLC